MEALVSTPPGDPLLHMCRYHLGLEEADGAPTRVAAGKMLRPALCLAMCEALEGSLPGCLPAALSVELVHRTILVFDDIQDNSPQRNHRDTVWRLWGVNQVLNAGLTLSCYGRLALQGMVGRVDPSTILLVERLLEHAVIDLCRGQHLDLHFQETMPSLAGYRDMVRLKTGVLIGAACQVGALVAGERERHMDALRFGEALGVAFQLQDDCLGVWGQSETLGKAPNDLEERKRSLPVVLAVGKSPRRWPPPGRRPRRNCWASRRPWPFAPGPRALAAGGGGDSPAVPQGAPSEATLGRPVRRLIQFVVARAV